MELKRMEPYEYFPDPINKDEREVKEISGGQKADNEKKEKELPDKKKKKSIKDPSPEKGNLFDETA